MIHSSLRCLLFAVISLFFLSSFAVAAESDLTDFDRQVKTMAETCRGEVIHEFEILLGAKRLNAAQLFDTFYIPVPNTAPQKFSTISSSTRPSGPFSTGISPPTAGCCSWWPSIRTATSPATIPGIPSH